jgi:NhaA family Na+:H+ antiporter
MSARDGAVRVFGTVVRPLQAFLRLEAASGILLLLCAIAAFAWANLDAASYRAIFEHPLAVGSGDEIAGFTVRVLINDALMAIFFFVVGMEIKRELAVGELSSPAKAALPAIAAVGGMVVPAGIFLAFNWGGPGQHGWGIPMATDIAFCIGVLTLLKERVPRALVVFVTALAIFDDIGGILVIALFYGHGLQVSWLVGAAGLILVLCGMAGSHVGNGVVYAIVGAALWYALHHGGIHATIAGVVLGFAIPARSPRPSRDVLRELASHLRDLDRKPPDAELEGAEILMIEEKLEDLQSPLGRFMHALHPYVAFAIMPLFALANSGVTIGEGGWSAATEPIALGTGLGLLLGKPIGIAGLTLLAVRMGIAPMPAGATAGKVIGASIVAGIGFTVALFIAGLAFPEAPELLDQAKLGILLGSLAAGACGFALLRSARSTL